MPMANTESLSSDSVNLRHVIERPSVSESAFREVGHQICDHFEQSPEIPSQWARCVAAQAGIADDSHTAATKLSAVIDMYTIWGVIHEMQTFINTPSATNDGHASKIDALGGKIDQLLRHPEIVRLHANRSRPQEVKSESQASDFDGKLEKLAENLSLLADALLRAKWGIDTTLQELEQSHKDFKAALLNMGCLGGACVAQVAHGALAVAFAIVARTPNLITTAVGAVPGIVLNAHQFIRERQKASELWIKIKSQRALLANLDLPAKTKLQELDGLISSLEEIRANMLKLHGKSSLTSGGSTPVVILTQEPGLGEGAQGVGERERGTGGDISKRGDSMQRARERDGGAKAMEAPAACGEGWQDPPRRSRH